MNQWIKFLQDTKDHKAGEQVSYPAAEAKTLVAAGIAENIEAPKEIAEPIAALKTAFEGMKSDLTKLVTDTIETARKNIPVADKPNHAGADISVSTIPATVKRYGSLQAFKGIDSRGRSAEQRAYEFGMWMLGMWGNEAGARFAQEKGLKYIADTGMPVNTKVSRENNNFSSGFLVPDQFENDLIDLREKFGVFRQYAKIVPMASDTRSDPGVPAA
jgi:HK97 family phage major capsid protein